MVRSVASEAGCHVTSSRAAVRPGKIATPQFFIFRGLFDPMARHK
jgi:hypothetical protein